MKRKIRGTLLFVLVLSTPASSFAWNPTLSLLGNNTITKGNDVVRSGMFDIQNRKFNLGLEFANKFYLNDQYFIKTGLRYSTFRTSVSGRNEVSSLIGQPYQVAWDSRYACLAVPVHFGKEFDTESGHKGDFYAGVSVGLLVISDATAGASVGPGGSMKNPDTITTRFPDPGASSPTNIMATADFGISYQPFISAPGFKVGFMCSIQLNKTNPYSFQATINDSRGNAYTYDLQHAQQITNCAFSLNYTFGNPNHRPSPRGGTHYVAPRRI